MRPVPRIWDGDRQGDVMIAASFRVKTLGLLLSGPGLAIWLAGCVVTPEPIPLFDGAVFGDLPPLGYDGGNEGRDGAPPAPLDLDYVPEDAATSYPDAAPPDSWVSDGWAVDGPSDGQPDGVLEDGGLYDGGSGEGGPVDDTGPADDLTGDVVSQE